MDQIIAQLFNARTIAHSIHLRVRSFSQHLALGEFYDELTEHADELAEIYQGKHGLLDIRPLDAIKVFSEAGAVPFIHSFTSWAEGVRHQLNPQDTYIINKWEELLALAYRAQYKLDNLA